MTGDKIVRRLMMAVRVLTLIGAALSGGVWGVQAAPVLAPDACPCSLWTDHDAPAQPAVTEGQPIEVGIKFRSQVDGYITGLRFFKGAANIGTHTGHLWAADGTLLAEAVFVEETASGWQTVALPEPVYILSNTTYVASYYSANGYYAFTLDYFYWGGMVRAPLEAVAPNGEYEPNGVYRLGSSGFPTSGTVHNYWVDVVFDTTAPPDSAPPTVAATSPASGASDVIRTSNVTARFSEALDPATVTAGTVTLRDSGNNLLPAVVTYNAAAFRVTLDPLDPLSFGATYTVRILGGSSGVKDRAGNALAADYVWTFTTQVAPPTPPDDGSGGPILVIGSVDNPFGRYLGEILRAEGYTSFIVTDISLVNAARLADYEVVILGEMPLDHTQVTMLTDWVTAGGNLIAMRPDPQLAGLLGLTPIGGTLDNAYVLIDTAAGKPGEGLVGETIQYHGPADRYALNGAFSLAMLYSDAATPTAYPAVTLNQVGTQGGQAAAFTFDLARSVVYTRQGNPAWAGQERNGDTLIRSNDLFYGNAAFDPQSDWIDFDKIAIPQADEQQRLLTNLMLNLNFDQTPLPRLWYFPFDKRAVVIMTGDNHGTAGTTGRFETYRDESPVGCDVADWECIRSTGYIYPGQGIKNAEVIFYTSLGFEVAVHVNTNCQGYDAASLDSAFATQLAAFAAAYPGGQAPLTNRTHCVPWSDWATQAKVSLDHGVRFDTNYYYWPGDWIQDRIGLFTGSGLPMRFADLDGTLIDVYQSPTVMTDESEQDYPVTVDTLLNRALGAEGYYGAFTVNMHTDESTSSLSGAVIGSAKARNVPVVSARQMLLWLDGRAASRFDNLAWISPTLSFDLTPGPNTNGLRAMLPLHSAAGALSALTRNGSPVAYDTQTIKGVNYAVFDGAAGAYIATYGAPLPMTFASPTAGCDGRVPCYSALASALAATADDGTVQVLGAHNVASSLSTADGGTRSVTLTGESGSMPSINWTGGAGSLFNVGAGGITLKGVSVQSAGGGTLFNAAGAGQLLAYANHFGSGFTSACTGANCAAALLGHNWWGTSAYASKPSGLNDASWNMRLGAPITQWSEGSGSASVGDSFGTAEVSGGSGPIVMVNHGATSPFFVATEPNPCSHFFDVFALPGASGLWDLAVPINTSICAAAPVRMLYMPANRLDNASCDAPASGCWVNWTPAARVADQFVAQGVTTAVLNGTPFTAGSATGTSPTAIRLKALQARSAGGDLAVEWLVGFGGSIGGLGLVMLIKRRRRA